MTIMPNMKNAGRNGTVVPLQRGKMGNENSLATWIVISLPICPSVHLSICLLSGKSCIDNGEFEATFFATTLSNGHRCV
jgi:hypothetical protein